MKNNGESYWDVTKEIFRQHKLGNVALYVVLAFCLIGVYAPFFASNKPFFVSYNGAVYFPFFRYLFYTGFYTKGIDIFFNLLMFTLPFFVLAGLYTKRKILYGLLLGLIFFQVIVFAYLMVEKANDPASNPALNLAKYQVIKKGDIQPSWDFELKYMTPYARLNLILDYIRNKNQQNALDTYQSLYKNKYGDLLPSLWQMDNEDSQDKLDRLKSVAKTLEEGDKIESKRYKDVQAQIRFVLDRRDWLATQSQSIKGILWPLVTPFHWEEDAGGSQSYNSVVGWLYLTRINQKNLAAALLFGIRVSLVVGLLSVALSLLIGIPIGAISGFYGGRIDIAVMRFLEIWESMPLFFMLLFVVAITQNKSIFLVISVIGFFNWTGISRYLRGEFFKQRHLSYVEACHSLGFKEPHIIFGHILPNAIPPVLTLLPFAIMGAITSEAGLSFLGLGEENSCSWGVLMDEGRQAFPGQSYLLWPPAILLTILLIAIALVGDALRDALDPKMHK